MTAVRLGAITDATLHVGTPALRDAAASLIARVESSAHVDLFRVDDRTVVDALAELAGRARLTALGDTDASDGRLAERLRERVAAGWMELGRDPLKQHGKSMSRDGGAEALVATDLSDADAARRIELAVGFTGDPARALARIHAASAGTDDLAASIDAAAALGVVVNDPRVAARAATSALEQLIDAPGDRLFVMTKSFDDPEFAERLADTARRGAFEEPIELLTHHVPKRQERVLERVGVLVHEVDEGDAERAGSALHGTLVDTQRGVFIGSPYLEERVLHGSDGRRSRELGVLLGGDAAAQAHDAWLQLLATSRSI